MWQSGWMVLEAFSVSYGRASSYLPVIDLLHGYFDVKAEDDGRRRREKVTGRVVALDPTLEGALPYLFSLLGIVEVDDPLAQMDGQIKKRRTLEAIKRMLLRESLNQPLLVVFEDLHWIDEQTQGFLNLLADSIGTAKILLLVNYRPEYSHQWNSKTCYTQLRLDPLGIESAGEMLAALLGSSEELAALKRMIVEKTEGNPFFMEEIVQGLFEQSALARNGEAKLSKSLQELKIPPTVQAMLAARIDRLPSAEKELLRTLAVIGKDLALELVKAVTGKSEEQLEPMLADLQLGEFIYEHQSLAGTEYTFKHALTQEVAYNSVLTEQRRAIHDQTASAIEALHAQQLEDHYSHLAHHYIRGSNAPKALRYAQLAARQAAGRAAYREAASLLETAMKLLDKLPDGAERMRAELSLRTVENTVAFALNGTASPECERAIRRMCELGEQISEADPDQVLRGRIALSNLYFQRGESLRGLELSRRCLELAETTQSVSLLAQTHWNLGALAYSCGKLREAVSSFEDGMRVLERANRSDFLFAGIMYRSGFACPLALAFQLLGRVDEAVKLAEQGLRHARESRHLFSLGHALTLAGGQLSSYRRETESVRACAEEAIALSEDYGFATWLAWGRFHHGWALAELGQLEQGVAEMEAGIAGFRRSGGVPRLQVPIALFASGYARMGRTEQALAMLNEALAHIERSGEKVGHAEMLRLKGELLLMRDGGATEEAERSFRAALEVARAQEARWWELRTTVSLARLLARTDRRDEARVMLANIYGWFTEGFDTADLKDAKALLDELSA
jgi:tetratricopeptide (TPR) repeat protein